ncbi:MAG: phosphatidylglycerophosphatase A [Desulfobulbaceae bacterium]|nr:phosphatidylglycerophosphatase A [Desulfobulbaceae bacterium]
MDRLLLSLATGLGLGYAPFAPGTFGTMLALPIHFLIVRLPLPLYAGALALLILVAIGAAGAAEKILDRPDPPEVVSDEVVGMLVAMIAIPPHPLAWLLAFGLFRLFDIVKPWPVGFIDRHFHGGLGIVLDDLAAGLYALAALQITWHLAMRGGLL